MNKDSGLPDIKCDVHYLATVKCTPLIGYMFQAKNLELCMPAY